MPALETFALAGCACLAIAASTLCRYCPQLAGGTNCISALPAALDRYLTALPAMSLIPSAPLKLVWLPSSLATTHRGFALITRTAPCLCQLPSCVAVYPRDSRSRRVLCRARPLGSIHEPSI